MIATVTASADGPVGPGSGTSAPPGPSRPGSVQARLQTTDEHQHSDRRNHPRHGLGDLPWLEYVRIKFGPEVSLIDLSVTGSQIETSARRLHPGAAITVELGSQNGPLSVPATVLRSHVVSLQPRPTYRGALEFLRPIVFPTPETDSPEALRLAHGRFDTALRHRMVGRVRAGKGPSTERLLTASDALATALFGKVHLEDARYRAEMIRLLRGVTKGLATSARADSLGAMTWAHVQRALGERPLTLLRAGAVSTAPRDSAMFFDVLGARTGAPARVIVDFARSLRVEQWHFQFLKCGARLLTVVNELDNFETEAVPAPKPLPTRSAPPMWVPSPLRLRAT